MEASSRDNPQLISVIPNKMVYNAKEEIALIFNNKLPSCKGGSFHVEFRGRKREVMQAIARRLNQSTLTVLAPEYFPAEKVKVHVRHVTREGSTSLGSHEFNFLSRDSMMRTLLEDFTDPVVFMCESLGISPSDMNALDRALTASFRTNIPPGFHLLGLRNVDIEHERSESLYPSLLHFAAAFGLHHFIKDCLRHCSGCFEAAILRNCHGERPSDLAYKGQFMNIYEILSCIESAGGDGDALYERMNESNEDDPYYVEVAQQGYINLQLWKHSEDKSDGYVDASRPDHYRNDLYTCMESGHDDNPDGYMTSRTEADHEDFYTDMDSGIEQFTTDADSYIEKMQSHVESDELYTDMESEPDQIPTDSDGYVRSHGLHPECDELYADMESNHGDLYVDVARNESEEMYMNEQDLYQGQASSYYQIPSNLPVCRLYPEERSVSVSVNRRSDHKQQKAKVQELPPAVPARRSEQEAQRLPPKPRRPPSTASGVSTISKDSGFHEENEDLFEDPKLIREHMAKNVEPVPPPPPADYNRPVSPKPKVSSRNHERSKTLPVSASDLNSARLMIPGQTSRSPSLKERPSVTNRPKSDIQAAFRPPPTPPTVNRRGSDDAASQRPPAPTPGSISSRQGIPSPFLMAMQEKQEPAPPAPPPRVTSKQPTPAPRGQRKY